MKNKSLPYIAFIIFIFSALYLISRLSVGYTAHHESLNHANMEPDLFLQNAKHYAAENIYDRSIFHLDKAMSSLIELENDIDVQSGKELDHALTELSGLKKKLMQHGNVTSDMNEVFGRILVILTKAELRISEMYTESHKQNLARVALKYAKLHLKNALNYAKLPERKFELQVYYDIDSLMRLADQNPIELSFKLDEMMAQLDEALVATSSR